MVLFLIITLAVSLVGIILILSVKRYEMRTGKMFFRRSRPALAKPFRTSSLIIEHLLPLIARRSIERGAIALRITLGRFLAKVTLMIESILRRMLAAIHRFVEPRESGGPASAFLQEVAAHKRKLLRRAPEKRAIFEE
ncbi:MAG TPA: hypothetical protein VD928_02960 [Candidatus Paceibacterota bacterium]|nr:hypothetical protein [Candidatus Paceibacterota bacterium]